MAGMRRVSGKRDVWLGKYKAILEAYTPTECARCPRKGLGWSHMGGDFEPHHPYRRFTEWRMCCILPLCHDCHTGPEGVEDNTTQARKDGWIVDV